jgi:hypothetical protein
MSYHHETFRDVMVTLKGSCTKSMSNSKWSSARNCQGGNLDCRKKKSQQQLVISPVKQVCLLHDLHVAGFSRRLLLLLQKKAVVL